VLPIPASRAAGERSPAAESTRLSITPGTFWIIGYPGETPESMRETLRVAAGVKYLFPSAGSEVYPFRPIPGTEDFETAKKLGYVPPKDFHEWGKCFEYKYNSHNTPLPDDVRETWRLYNNTSAIYDRKIHEGPKWMRETLAQIAGWRLKKQRYGFPLEQKLFDIYVRATGQLDPGGQDYVPAVDA
jgi:radical SAM superfamily enzyme YgiQ (UPF0313 family)